MTCPVIVPPRGNAITTFDAGALISCLLLVNRLPRNRAACSVAGPAAALVNVNAPAASVVTLRAPSAPLSMVTFALAAGLPSA